MHPKTPLIIYKATNRITGDFYIGATKNPFRNRIRRHLSDSRSKPKQHFHHAIKKYGPDSFDWEIIDSSAQTPDELYEIEKKVILQLNPKYNKDQGGRGVSGHIPWNKGGTLPQEVKDRISKTLTGRKLSDEHKLNQIKNKKNFKLSEETKRKISEAHKGRVHTEEARKRMGRKKADSSVSP